MNHFTLKFFTMAWLCWMSLMLEAQDIHYSQFGNSALNLNPALTGMYEGDGRVYLHHRNQWYGVPVSYRSFSGSYDKRFIKKSGMHSPWAAGLLFNYDRAGDSRLSMSNLGLNVSYMQRITRKSFISLGVAPGIIYRGFDETGLRWDNNYNGNTNNLPDQETFEKYNRAFGDVSTGLNLHFRGDTSRTTFDIGAGLYHLVTGNTNFDANAINIPQRLSLYGLGTFQLSRKFDLMVNAIQQYQGPHRETVYGGHIKYHISQKIARETAISFGVGNRNKDAWFPQVNFWYQGWKLGASYDMNTSKFSSATNSNGGPELSLVYIWRKAPKVEYCPLCPRMASN